jgi:hypothetical protein
MLVIRRELPRTDTQSAGNGDALERIHCGGSSNPRITIFAVVCSVGQTMEVMPAATATICEPWAM